MPGVTRAAAYLVDRASRGQIENYVIQALRNAGCKLHNKRLAYDTSDQRRAHATVKVIILEVNI